MNSQHAGDTERDRRKENKRSDKDAPIDPKCGVVKELVNCQTEHDASPAGNHIAEVHGTVHIAGLQLKLQPAHGAVLVHFRELEWIENAVGENLAPPALGAFVLQYCPQFAASRFVTHCLLVSCGDLCRK